MLDSQHRGILKHLFIHEYKTINSKHSHALGLLLSHFIVLFALMYIVHYIFTQNLAYCLITATKFSLTYQFIKKPPRLSFDKTNNCNIFLFWFIIHPITLGKTNISISIRASLLNYLCPIGKPILKCIHLINNHSAGGSQ